MKDGKRNGKGKMTWIDGDWKGDIYEGEFKDDFRNVRGIYKWKIANFYNREWNKGDKHGWGIWKNYYSIYEGEFKNDKREGKGKMTYKDKWDGVYEGGWKNDKKHGRGICTKYGERHVLEWDEGHYAEPNSGRKAGRFLDAHGNEIGRIDNDENLYDEKGNHKGKMDSNGNKYDKIGSYKGKLDNDGDWHDRDYHKKGNIYNNGEIRDENNNIFGRFEED